MANYRIIQNSFIGGLASPLAEGAIGVTGYNQSLSISENVLYGPGYGISKRHGTKYQFDISETILKIFPIVFHNKSLALAITSGGESTKMYVCSFEKQSPITPFSLASPVYAEYELSKTGAISDGVDTPFSIDDAPELDIKCIDDKIYIVHRNIHPKVITISEDNNVYLLSTPVDVEFISPVATANKKTEAYTFNSDGDYPAHQLFYQGRWLLFSTKNNPSAVYFSRSFDIEKNAYRYNDFTYSQQEKRLDDTDWQYITLADLAGIYINASMYDSDIRWVIQYQGAMLVATGRAIYSDGGNTITATTDSPLSLTKIINTGAATNLVASIDDYIFFVGADNRTVRVLIYNSQKYSFSQAIISTPVAHLIQRDIKELTITNGIMPLIWIRTETYELLYCYFEQAQISAWSRFTFESTAYASCIASIEGGTDGLCSLAMYVRRPGMNHSDVETFDVISPDEVWKYPQVDSSKCIINHGTSDYEEITDFDVNLYGNPRNRHIGEYIKANEDSSSFMISTIDTNQENKIYFKDSNYIFLGFKYNMAIGTLRQELPANGTSQSNLRAIRTVTLRLYKSYGGKIALRPSAIDDKVFSAYNDKTEDCINKDDLIEILYQQYNSQKYNLPHKLFTGDKEINLTTNVISDDRIVIISSSAYPLIISAIIVNFIYSEV